MELRSLFRKIFGTENDNQPANMQELRLLNDWRTVFNQKSNYTDDILVRTCVDTIAKHCGKLRMIHIEKKDGRRAPVTDSPMLEMLQLSPNPYMTAYDFLYKMAASMCVNQNAFATIQRDKQGSPIALYPIDFQSAELKEAQNEVFVRFLFRTGKRKTIPYADLIHVRRNFQAGEIISISSDDLDQNLRLLALLQQSFANSAVNSGKIRGVLRITGQAESGVWKEKARSVTSNLQDRTQGGIVTTDNTMDFQPVNANPIAADHSQLDYVRQNIYRYFGISEKIVAEEYNEQEWQAFYESTIEPFALAMGQELTRKLFTPLQRAAGNAIFLDARRLSYADTKSKVEMIKELRPLGILTTNDCLEIMNLPRIEGGDDRVQTLNVANTELVDQYQQGKAGMKDTENKEGEDENDGDEEKND